MIVLVIADALWLARSSETSTWPNHHIVGNTYPFDQPAFLLAEHQRALIWRPADARHLMYTSLENPANEYSLLPYPDVSPRAWAVAPAGDTTFHIVWQDDTRTIQSALIGQGGETLRGPIELATDSNSAPLLFAVHGRALALWTDGDAKQLAGSLIDPSGRPRPIIAADNGEITHLAGAIDREGTLHLTWLTPELAGGWAVQIQTIAFDALDEQRLGEGTTLYTIDQIPGTALASFSMGVSSTHGIIFWSTQHIDQPDVEQVMMLSFPLADPGAAEVGELHLPTQIPDDMQASSSLLIPLQPSTSEHTDLRWPMPATSPQGTLALVLTVRLAEGWRPAIVYFQQGQPTDYQIAASQPADGGPPSLALDPEGVPYVAWKSLHDAEIILHSAHTGPLR